MTRTTRMTLFTLTVCLCFSISALAIPVDRTHAGSVEKVRNLAKATYRNDTRRLAKGAAVHQKDSLTTGADARLSVLLDDGSHVSLGENAELLIDDFVYVPKSRTTISLNAVRGALRFVGSKKLGRYRRDVKVKTPVATLGIRGTDFWVGRIDGDTGVLVLSGKVLVESSYGLLMLRPGEGTMIKDDGTLSRAKKWGEVKKERALRTIAF